MIRTAAGLAVLLSSFTLGAQNTAPSESSKAQYVQPMNAACPIGMQASQSLWNHNIAVQKGLGNQKFGQRLSLALKDPRQARITGARVRVHGLTGKNRMLQTGNRSDGAESATTVHLSFGPKNDNEVVGDLWIPGFTAVTTVELQEVSYSDGSV